MKPEEFINVAEAALDSLPQEFRSRIQNVAILVEDFPPNQSPPQPGKQRRLLLGIFHGVPATKKSVFDLSGGPAHIVLFQKNIEAVCSSDAEVRHQICLTLMHELGHYFGMTEKQLRGMFRRFPDSCWSFQTRAYGTEHTGTGEEGGGQADHDLDACGLQDRAAHHVTIWFVLDGDYLYIGTANVKGCRPSWSWYSMLNLSYTRTRICWRRVANRQLDCFVQGSGWGFGNPSPCNRDAHRKQRCRNPIAEAF